MRRFVALSWDATHPRAHAAAVRAVAALRDWREAELAVVARGLYVAHDWPGYGCARAWALPSPLPGATGVVLGTLFRSTPANECVTIDAIDTAAAERILLTQGRELLERYWGSFVAFLVDERHHSRVVLRSAGAGIACYCLRRPPLEIYFSDLADLSMLGFETPGVDWPYMAAFLNSSQLAVRDCALEDVTEILAGERVYASGGREDRTFLWTPTVSCRSTPADDLRSVTQECVEAWATGSRHVLLHLSGGFDSAVVLGCLSRGEAQPQITCLNRYGDAAGEDERGFARAAARLAGVQLIERGWEASDVRLAERLADIPVAPKPTVQALLQMETRVRDEVAAEVGAETCWSGQGGDHLYFQFETELMVADFVRQLGWTPALGSVLCDAVRLTRQPIWKLLRLAFTARWTRYASTLVPTAPVDASFLNAESAQAHDASKWMHPWLRMIDEMPPGKQLQIRALSELLHRHAPFTRGGVPEVHPLISQPLMELCLQIPSWEALRGGRTRGLARRAFADRIPAVIRHRETKGGTCQFLMSVIRREAPLICELLLEGALAKHGLLNRAALERHLRPLAPLRQSQFFPLLACVAAEVWLRTLKARQRSYCWGSSGSEASRS